MEGQLKWKVVVDWNNIFRVLRPYICLGIIVLGFMSAIPASKAHPQCLDFSAPFTHDQGSEPEFCTLYIEFGCCTRARDQEIKQNFQRIVSEYNSIHGSLSSNCSDFLNEILCQECSPYAAHIYDGESSRGNARQLPGLCSGYCTEFHRSCSQLVPFITEEEPLRRAATSSSAEFCEMMAILDVDYCFPDVLVSDDLNRWAEEARSGTGRSNCLCLEEFASGLRKPVFAVHANDNTHRFFIGEQRGIIHVFLTNGTKLETAFLDLQDSVHVTANLGERGLLGAAFHPNFTDNSKLYICYTLGPGVKSIRISEFTVMTDDMNRVDTSMEKVLLEFGQPYSNHNGGQLLFGIDGYLYASFGDGGSGGDPLNAGLNRNTLLGKIIRIDVDNPSGDRNYGIPPDNPFVGVADTRPEIYAYGVRNSWRGSIDHGDRVTGKGKGRIFFGDVGQNQYEEVNIIVKGGNYGWRAKEGYACFKQEQCNEQWLANEVQPVHVYSHSEGKCVIGGYVYRGCQSPNLYGKFIFGDYYNGHFIFSAGEVYLLSTIDSGVFTDGGKILKIVDPGRRGNPSECNRETSNPVDFLTTAAETTTTGGYLYTVESNNASSATNGLFTTELEPTDPASTTGRPSTTELLTTDASQITTVPWDASLTTDRSSITTDHTLVTSRPSTTALPATNASLTTGRSSTTNPPTTEPALQTGLSSITEITMTKASLTTGRSSTTELQTSNSTLPTGLSSTTEITATEASLTAGGSSTTKLLTTDSALVTARSSVTELPTTDFALTTGRPAASRLSTTDASSSTDRSFNTKLSTTDSASATSRPSTKTLPTTDVPFIMTGRPSIKQQPTDSAMTTDRSSAETPSIYQPTVADSATEILTKTFDIILRLRILALNGTTARYTDILADSTSQAFREISSKVTVAVIEVLRSSPTTAFVVDFVVSSIRNGSLLVSGAAIYPVNSMVEPEALVDVLNSAGEAERNAHSLLTIDPSATYATVANEGCPPDFCKNGGNCTQLRGLQDPVYSCECVGGYSGSSCDILDVRRNDGIVVPILAAFGGFIVITTMVLILTWARISGKRRRPQTYASKMFRNRAVGLECVETSATRPPTEYGGYGSALRNFYLPYVVQEASVENSFTWDDSFFY
ncbi:HHIP-like protein 2 [Acanthaster planci]|uniref:HHIP-like protein 2 n=1 Tax=Acanthaster planci TaxID=133434 RepID=A0A8B7YSZ4_ACAPL|nr:HHIP-like protein 2 [Acanthaster planci]